jgi:hypothetical protein
MIEAQEEEPSPIYDHSYSSPHQQYQEEPPPPKSSALEEAMSAFLSHSKEYNHQLQSTMAKMEAHLKQISKILKEGECSSQLVANPNEYYMEDECTYYQ